jgi:hypothetical protein
MAGTLKSHPRIQELFHSPRFSGSGEDFERLAQTRVYVTDIPEDGIVSIVCPYCTWENTHSIRGKGGHRACDGPRRSKFTAHGVMRPNYNRYDCPGYTLVLR